MVVRRSNTLLLAVGLLIANAGHLLGEEERGSSFGGIKKEVVVRGPATKLINRLLYLGIALVDGDGLQWGRAWCRRHIDWT